MELSASEAPGLKSWMVSRSSSVKAQKCRFGAAN